MSLSFQKLQRRFSRCPVPEDSTEPVGTSLMVPEEPTKHGLFIVHPAANVEATESYSKVDIIAVHGLGGDARKTWTDPPTGKFWLRDFLPAAVPEARIMTFGYDSTLAFSRSHASITHFARDLLNRLRSLRHLSSNKDARDRPIILIAHSLGGIIVKKALILAHESEIFYGHILRSTQGIVFLGTPHRGSGLAAWSSLFASVVNSVSFGQAVRKRLLVDLTTKSLSLLEISQQFVQRSVPLQIMSFTEQQIMRPLTTLVVNDASAVMGLPNEIVFPVSADHRNICRYSTDQSEVYVLVEAAIKELAVRSAPVLSTTEASAASSSRTRQESHLETVHRTKQPLPVSDKGYDQASALSETAMNLEQREFYPHNFLLRNAVDEEEDLELGELCTETMPTETVPTIPVKIHGLKRISLETGEVEDFSTTLQLKSDLKVSSISWNIGDCRGFRVSDEFKFWGQESPISPTWVDVCTKPVEVTSGRPCYDHLKGYKIHVKQTLAEFFSKAFPHPVETKLFADQVQTSETENRCDEGYPAKIVNIMTGDECALSISFMRTLRIPEDGKIYPLPAGLGKLPLFNIQDFAHAVPPEMLGQGGVFLPMYQSEAMWMAFKCHNKRPWAIRPFLGGVNGISGDIAMGDMNSLLKRINTVSTEQDYIVLPQQKWLDGVATQPGIVKQFVAAQLEAEVNDATSFTQDVSERNIQPSAMPADCTSERKAGCSLEWQLTGRNYVGGVQLQIIPAHDTARIHFANIPDWLQIDGKSISNKTQVPTGARTYDIFKPPKELWLENGDIMHVKDLLKQEKERPKVIKDLLKESPVTLEGETINVEAVGMTYIGLSPGPEDTDIIYIKGLIGQPQRFRLITTSTVLDLKGRVQDREGIPPDQQRFIYCGKLLEDHKTLSDYGVRCGETIHLVLRLRGGGDHSRPVHVMINGEKQTVIAWNLGSLKKAIYKNFQIPVERQVISLDGIQLKQWEPNDDIPEVLELSLLPTDQVRMGIGIGGNIKQNIEPDEHSPRIWDVANSRILNVQIINSVDFHAITGRPPPPTPITTATYAALKIPFFKTYRDDPPSYISGAFETVKTVGSIETDNMVKDNLTKDKHPEPDLLLLTSKPMDDSDSEDSKANCRANESKLLSDARVIMLEIDGTISEFRSATEYYFSGEDDSDIAAAADDSTAARLGKKRAGNVSGNEGKRKRDQCFGPGMSKRRSMW